MFLILLGVHSERLTKVIDDESDYYTPSSVWLSAEEKVRLKKREAELHAQQHASRRDKKFTLDFSGNKWMASGFYCIGAP